MKNSTLILFAVAALILFLWYRSRQKSTQIASVPMNPIAKATTYITNPVTYTLDKGGVVGREANAVLNAPLTNITSGNAKATAESILTGGLSDVW
jgi:hypothetical protein